MKKKKVQKKAIPEDDYICIECAKNLGGTWPKVHCATFHMNKCCVCNRFKSLCSTGDFNWPDGKHRGLRD